MFGLKAGRFNDITASHVDRMELVLFLLMILFTEHDTAAMMTANVGTTLSRVSDQT